MNYNNVWQYGKTIGKTLFCKSDVTRKFLDNYNIDLSVKQFLTILSYMPFKLVILENMYAIQRVKAYDMDVVLKFLNERRGMYEQKNREQNVPHTYY